MSFITFSADRQVTDMLRVLTRHIRTAYLITKAHPVQHLSVMLLLCCHHCQPVLSPLSICFKLLVFHLLREHCIFVILTQIYRGPVFKTCYDFQVFLSLLQIFPKGIKISLDFRKHFVSQFSVTELVIHKLF